MCISLFIEPIDTGSEMMAAIHERDEILRQYLEEWDELELDLVMSPAALLPAPLKVLFF
jgi:hypothetical protein